LLSIDSGKLKYQTVWQSRNGKTEEIAAKMKVGTAIKKVNAQIGNSPFKFCVYSFQPKWSQS